MEKATASNSKAITTAVKAGVEYVKSLESASARLWEFGKAVSEAVEGAERGTKAAIAKAMAKATGRTFETCQVEVSKALRCFATYESAESASSWTLNEVSGRKSATASVFDADKWAKSFATKHSKAEVRKAIAALQANL